MVSSRTELNSSEEDSLHVHAHWSRFTSSLWYLAIKYAVTVYNSSELQQKELLKTLEDRSVKFLFMGIEPSGGVSVLDLDTLQACSARTLKVVDGMCLSTEDSKSHGLARRLSSRRLR